MCVHEGMLMKPLTASTCLSGLTPIVVETVVAHKRLCLDYCTVCRLLQTCKLLLQTNPHVLHQQNVS